MGSDFVLSSMSSELSPQDSKAIRDTRVYYVYSEEYTTYTQGVALHSGYHLRNPQGSDFVLSSLSSELSPQDSKAIRDTRVYYVYSEEYTTYTQGC